MDQKKRTENVEALIAKCRPVFALQQKPWTTEKQYLHFIRDFLWFTFTQPDSFTSEIKFENYLTHLAVNKQVAASTQNVAFNAVRWFYLYILKRELKDIDAFRATRPATVRTALPAEDVRLLLDDVRDLGFYSTRLAVRLCYSCGMRVSEVCSLRVKDVIFDRDEIVIRGGKGKKDGVIGLPADMAVLFRRQLVIAKRVFDQDAQAKIPIQIDGALPRKYPEYRFSWYWAWVFPQKNTCLHPRTNERVRFHMPKDAPETAVRESRRRLGLNPQLTPHVLRHSFATHLLDAGANIKALQEHMRHSDPRTTMGYCHAEAKSLPDPIMLLPGARLRQTTIYITEAPTRRPQLLSGGRVPLQIA